MMNSPPIVKQTRSACRMAHRRLSSLRIQDAQSQRPLSFSRPSEKTSPANTTATFAVSRNTPSSLRKTYETSFYASQTPNFGNGGYVQQMLLSTFSSPICPSTQQVSQDIKVSSNDEIPSPTLSYLPPGSDTPLAPDHPFTRFHLLVGEITSCEPHPTAERLYIQKVKLSCVTKNDRTIISGLRAYFPTPESLIGQKCIVVANMPKRKIRGVWSEGMLLCGTKDEGVPTVELLRPPVDAKPGERVIVHGQKVSSNPTDSVKSKSELKKIEGIWEEVVSGFGVDTQGHGVYQGRTLHVNGKGPCVCESIKSGSLY